MLFPSLDLRYITQQFDAAVVAVSQATAPAVHDTDHSPSVLQQADLIESVYADLVHTLAKEAPRFSRMGCNRWNY
jgi:hypothetical protein